MDSKQPDNGTDQLENAIRNQLASSGLMPLGWFDVDGASALLIGNIGSSFWPAFSVSNENLDGKPDPLNRWTTSVIAQSVAHLPDGTVSEVRYPFGEPVWPFQQYARLALGVEQSPLGLLIHHEFGLWFAFRAALVFAPDVAAPLPRSGALDHPCDSCIEKPCLNTCPIGAFTAEAYDYPACKSHVGSEAGKTCFTDGCLARQIGRAHV